MGERQIVLDTETTGLDPQLGHRIIEIGAIELIKRKKTENRFHAYLNPDREIDDAAYEVHGISYQDLKDKPRFEDIVDDLVKFISGAELIIHNAPFDVAFLDAEFARVDHPESRTTAQFCAVLDSLIVARRLHPGQRNSLDALCNRYLIDNSARTLHGALLDAEILADVYLAMTGGQTSFLSGRESIDQQDIGSDTSTDLPLADPGERNLPVVIATDLELADHAEWIRYLEQNADQPHLWPSSDGQE